MKKPSGVQETRPFEEWIPFSFCEVATRGKYAVDSLCVYASKLNKLSDAD